MTKRPFVVFGISKQIADSTLWLMVFEGRFEDSIDGDDDDDDCNAVVVVADDDDDVAFAVTLAGAAGCSAADVKASIALLLTISLGPFSHFVGATNV